MRAAAHGLQGSGIKALEAEFKIPNDEALLVLRDCVCHHKMRLAQRDIHMAEDSLHLGQTAHFVKRIFEVCIACVDVDHAFDSTGLQTFKNIRVPNPVQANEVFAVMPRALNEKLAMPRALDDVLLPQGAKFYDWMPDSLGDGISDDEIFVRFVLSFATPESDVRKLLALIKELQP